MSSEKVNDNDGGAGANMKSYLDQIPVAEEAHFEIVWIALSTFVQAVDKEARMTVKFVISDPLSYTNAIISSQVATAY